MKYNTPLFVLFIIFLLVNIADAITAFFILPGESNPLFHLFGSIWPVILLKFIVVGLFYLWVRRNKFPTEFSLYLFVLVLMLGTLMVSFGVFSNVRGIQNPELLAAAAEMPTQEKVQAYFIFTGVVYLFPFGISTFAFKVFQWVRKRALIDLKYQWKFWRK